MQLMEHIKTLVSGTKRCMKDKSGGTTHYNSVSSRLLSPHLTATMKSLALFYIIATTSLGLTSRSKPVFPVRIPTTSLSAPDTACPSNYFIDEEVCKTISMLGTEIWFHPYDCNGLDWKKTFYYKNPCSQKKFASFMEVCC